MADILVLGGTYFIGLKTVERLAGRGHAVTTLNRGTRADRLPGTVENLSADRTDHREVERVLEGRHFDGVVEVSWLGPEATRRTARMLGDRIGAYLFISSAAVYAPSEVFPLSEDSPRLAERIDEGEVDESVGYGWRKGKAEDLLGFLGKTGVFHSAAVRPFYVYGEGNNLDRDTRLLDRADRGRPALIPGHGQGIIHLGHVEDLARAVCGIFELLLEGDHRVAGEAFNFGGPELVTVEGLHRQIEQTVGREPGELERVHFPPDRVDSTREHFPFRYEHFFGDLHRLEELGLGPEITLSEGLERTWRWHREREIERDWSAQEAIVERFRG